MRFLFFFVFMIFFSSCEEPVEPQDDNSLYISEVFRYVYAPGQHAALALPSDSTVFIGNPDDDSRFLYLGGFGGYIVAGFDHDIVNHAGADFEVILMKSSTPEPAVVYIMPDVNSDGKPNETWYELKGSQFENSKRNYWVRYYKAKTINENTTWLDSEGTRGELKSGYGATNSSGWWWSASVGDSITFYGTRLPDSYENTGAATTQLWTVPTGKYAWGYAENNSGTDYDSDKGSNKLDISNAVDESGNLISLANIRFLKIQTGVLQQAGWLNEVSSELRGAKEIKY
jgi:hypothetical protein